MIRIKWPKSHLSQNVDALNEATDEELEQAQKAYDKYPPPHRLITGQGGSGKTVAASLHAAQMAQAGIPVVILDMKPENFDLSQLFRSRDAKELSEEG